MGGPIGFNFLKAGVVEICQRTRPHTSVFFDGALQDLGSCSPYVDLPVGRNWLEGRPEQIDPRLRDFAMQPVWPTEDQNHEMGRRLADVLVEIAPECQLRQGYNEFPTDLNVSQFSLFCALEIGLTERLHERGYKSVVVNAPVGNLSPDTFLIFAPLLAIADYLGVHTYGADNGQLMQREPQWYFNRPLAWVVEATRRDLRIPPMLRTEAGTYRPWKQVWPEVEVSPVSAEEVGDDLIWAGLQITGVSFEGGLAAYCYNSNGDRRWDCYTLDDEPGILAKIEEFNALHPVGHLLPASHGLPLLPGNDPNDYLNRYGEGFARALWSRPDLVGEPKQGGNQICTEQETAGDSFVAMHLKTTRGRLWWMKAQNLTVFIGNDGRVDPL